MDNLLNHQERGEGGFLEPIRRFEERVAFISITKGVECDKRNPPLHKYTYLLLICPHVSGDLPSGLTASSSFENMTRFI
jgi:hypothetical protein